ncbi:MAG: type II secretion system protein [Planctomycetota bacterium]|nr:type II secretion system protein [Planctomycetota bacterium]
MSASLGRKAFTLVELMVVIAIIGILLALLMPGLTLVGASVNQARCASNLNRLYQAISLRTADEVMQANQRVLRASAWPAQILPYLESGAQLMICPAGGESMSEDGASGAGDTSLSGTIGGQTSGGGSSGTGSSDWSNYAQLSDLIDVMTDCMNGTKYIVPAEEGRWCLKLSDDQYAAARGQGLLNDADSANYTHTKFDTTYQPGANRHSYWLCVEDHGDDEDYKDVMIHVTENKDGSFSLAVSSGQTGHTNYIINKPEGAVLMQVQKSSASVNLNVKPSDSPNATGTGSGGGGPLYAANQQDDPISSAVVSTSYAMNVYYPQMTRKGSKILLMDYIRYLAYVNDDWGGEKMDPLMTGTPIFARHTGRMNVLYSDGSVAAEDPQDINPVVPANERTLWDP